ncbi:hypothetical protein H072_7399 [Dactylellina haptotyla CBS 200.50]|uniref:Uncharacterized protein n=1 Tax=Dactylellina haptotyla (strain CBS 200.50) TaxID=1284197 RepID=S8A7R3_DACHA|nr:hypothetical protein H072_7399 [Dactylellina haptotyla CBS 200.50]
MSRRTLDSKKDPGILVPQTPEEEEWCALKHESVHLHVPKLREKMGLVVQPTEKNTIQATLDSMYGTLRDEIAGISADIDFWHDSPAMELEVYKRFRKHKYIGFLVNEPGCTGPRGLEPGRMEIDPRLVVRWWINNRRSIVTRMTKKAEQVERKKRGPDPYPMSAAERQLFSSLHRRDFQWD